MSNWSVLSQKILYGWLIIITILSATAFFLHVVSPQFADIWKTYTIIYLALLALNSWYIMVLVIYSDIKAPAKKKISDQLMTVIIPSYNEKLDLLAKTVESVLNAKGNKQIIIMDDGSTNNSPWLMDILAKRSNITLHRFDKNQGKREALHYAVSNLVDPNSFCVITIDSDTILDRDALVKIAAPLLADEVGATTGNVLLLNEKKNLLTRMAGTYYWMGLNIYKKAQSGIGNVVCCSGCLSAYKTSLFKSIIDEFNSQTFLGEKATHSEDRHLTNLILRRSYKVIYVDDAVCYTETPETLWGFCRQQLRWKRGYVRESLYTLSYAWKNQRRLFFQILFWDLTAPYITLGLRLYILTMLIISPAFVLFIVLPLWIAAMLMRYVIVIMRAPEKIPGLFIYAFFFELILYWVNLYALLTVRNKRWVTRGI